MVRDLKQQWSLGVCLVIKLNVKVTQKLGHRKFVSLFAASSKSVPRDLLVLFLVICAGIASTHYYHKFIFENIPWLNRMGIFCLITSAVAKYSPVVPAI